MKDNHPKFQPKIAKTANSCDENDNESPPPDDEQTFMDKGFNTDYNCLNKQTREIVQSKRFSIYCNILGVNEPIEKN